MSQDTKYMMVMMLIVAIIFSVGFMVGYAHVVMSSEAYCIDSGDTLILEVDGRAYQYLTSPKFYERLMFRNGEVCFNGWN